MTNKINGRIISYVTQTIIGFESGLYKMIEKMNIDSNLSYLLDNHQPFIVIFRDLHENHFTRTFRSIFDDKSVEPIVYFFNELEKISKHNKICLLNIIANLTVSVHFNLDRKKLNINNCTNFIKSLIAEINRIILAVDISKLFDHECTQPTDIEIINFKKREKFIDIELRNFSNSIK